MPPPWTAVAQVRIVGEMHGSETNNVLHFGHNLEEFDDIAGIRDNLLELANHVIACVRDTLLPAVTSDWRLSRIEALTVHPIRTDPIVVTGTPADVGELAATNVSFAATLVNIRSGVGGRRGRGRMFLPPPGDAQMTTSDIDEPTMLLLLAFLTCLAEKFMGADKTTEWTLGILSQTDLGGLTGNFDLAFRDALSLNPVSRVAVMSSRKKGRGI